MVNFDMGNCHAVYKSAGSRHNTVIFSHIQRKRDTVNFMEMNSNTCQEINNESYGIQATCTNSRKGKYTNRDG